MFKFDNSHIFTGYLKQLLSSVNIPTCRIYTREFAEYFSKHGKEDPRVIESFDCITDAGLNTKRWCGARVNYLKGSELFNYFWEYSPNGQDLGRKNHSWRRASAIFYNSDKNIPGLTRVLHSPGGIYDTATHEHLGNYLRFLRDYHNINLMSLYNCFNSKICNNIYYKHGYKVPNPAFDPNASDKEAAANKQYNTEYRVFDSQDSKVRIYAFPVKLFQDYTVAIDCHSGIELFCGLYSTSLDTSAKGQALISKTYKKVNRTYFNRPFLFNKLNVENWNFENDTRLIDGKPKFTTGADITRWDIANREQDLKLFMVVPSSCTSSITVLEGNFIGFNDVVYTPNGNTTAWEYRQNHTVVNFGDVRDRNIAGLDTNNSPFTPISKLQLLAFNTGESYPFADRLVEYLCGSTITPIDQIADNIKRAQRVMSQNRHYFRVEGLWEDKMQKIIYDYIINAGPVTVEGNRLIDKRSGYHSGLGHASKSTLYDVLGYVDKEAEKWYVSWKADPDRTKAVVRDSIQNVDIYDGLYDI